MTPAEFERTVRRALAAFADSVAALDFDRAERLLGIFFATEREALSAAMDKKEDA